MGQKPSQKTKNADIERIVKEAWKNGQCRFSAHVLCRMAERKVTQMDIRDVLLTGTREKSRDRFNTEYNRWSYSWRGVIEGGRNLRIVLTERKPLILIITAVDLNNEDVQE